MLIKGVPKKRGEASREPSAVGKRTRVSRSRVQKAVPLRLAAEDSSKQNEPHQLHAKHDDEAGGDNCGLQIQRQREVGGGTEKLEEGGHAAIRQEGVRRPITLNVTISAGCKTRRRCFCADPAAGQLETPLHPRPHNTRDYRLDPKPPRARRAFLWSASR
jgi:hypothetical protein